MPGKQRRRSILAMTSLALAATATRAGAEGPTVRFDFEDVPVGQLPTGVTTGLTGGGGPVKWSVIEDKTAPVGAKVLAQTSTDRTDHRFPLAIFDQTAKDAMVTVRFKA